MQNQVYPTPFLDTQITPKKVSYKDLKLWHKLKIITLEKSLQESITAIMYLRVKYKLGGNDALNHCEGFCAKALTEIRKFKKS